MSPCLKILPESTTYYPYGEPTIEPQGQRFLFGGKEREHAAGRNSYDFGARNLAANAWTTPDPLAEKFYPLSPYSYCGGDPINRVDRDGRWTVYLSNDPDLNRKASKISKDTRIHVVAHGNTQYMLYDRNSSKKGIHIKSGKMLTKAIQKNLFKFRDISQMAFVEIILHSCNTGVDAEDGGNALAQKISSEIPNAIITAPNGFLHIDENGKESVSQEKYGEKKSKTDSWRVFFRGLEIPIDCIELIKEILIKEEELRRMMEQNKELTQDSNPNSKDND